MVKTALKTVQVQGKKYDLPSEEIEIQKLIKKGLSIQSKLSSLKERLEHVKSQIIKIAKKRREESTTVKLQAISGASIVTFRETYECKEAVEEIKQDLGSLFDRFFKKDVSYKPQKELKLFLEGKHAYGFKDPEPIKKLILSYVRKKETKPNVKLEAVN